MITKNKAYLALIAIAPILLSGCAASPAESTASGSDISSSVSDVSEVPTDTSDITEAPKDTSEIPEKSEDSAGEGATGLNGERINGESSELPPEYGTGWRYTDFGYIAVSDGAVKSITPDELNNIDTGTTDLKYAHTELGTKFGPLTLSQVSGMLTYGDSQEPSLFSQWLTLTGDITLKGWLTVYGDDAEGYLYPGDIYFYPGDGEWSGLPMTADEPYAFYLSSDTILLSNAPTLYLGTREDYSIDELDSISSDTMYEVEITFSDPCIRYDVSKGAYSSFINPATLKEIASYKKYQK
jgi:hypothetical protein